MKALPISVYRDDLGDCTNGGITSKYDRLLLVCEDGFIHIDDENPPENLVVLVSRDFGGREYKHLEPFKSPDSGCIGWMYGGNIACTSDSRFPSEYPLRVHDRQETPEQYRIMTE